MCSTRVPLGKAPLAVGQPMKRRVPPSHERLFELRPALPYAAPCVKARYRGIDPYRVYFLAPSPPPPTHLHHRSLLQPSTFPLSQRLSAIRSIFLLRQSFYNRHLCKTAPVVHSPAVSASPNLSSFSIHFSDPFFVFNRDNPAVYRLISSHLIQYVQSTARCDSDTR